MENQNPQTARPPPPPASTLNLRAFMQAARASRLADATTREAEREIQVAAGNVACFSTIQICNVNELEAVGTLIRQYGYRGRISLPTRLGEQMRATLRNRAKELGIIVQPDK